LIYIRTTRVLSDEITRANNNRDRKRYIPEVFILKVQAAILDVQIYKK